MSFSFPKFTYEWTITKTDKGYKAGQYGLLGSLLVKIGVWNDLAQRTAQLIKEIDTTSMANKEGKLQQLTDHLAHCQNSVVKSMAQTQIIDRTYKSLSSNTTQEDQVQQLWSQLDKTIEEGVVPALQCTKSITGLVGEIEKIRQAISKVPLAPEVKKHQNQCIDYLFIRTLATKTNLLPATDSEIDKKIKLLTVFMNTLTEIHNGGLDFFQKQINVSESAVKNLKLDVIRGDAATITDGQLCRKIATEADVDQLTQNLTNTKDSEWLVPIAQACGQTTYNGFVGVLKGNITQLHATTSEQDTSLEIKLERYSRPVNVELIRDSAGEIKQVQVFLQDALLVAKSDYGVGGFISYTIERDQSAHNKSGGFKVSNFKKELKVLSAHELEKIKPDLSFAEWAQILKKNDWKDDVEYRFFQSLIKTLKKSTLIESIQHLKTLSELLPKLKFTENTPQEKQELVQEIKRIRAQVCKICKNSLALDVTESLQAVSPSSAEQTLGARVGRNLPEFKESLAQRLTTKGIEKETAEKMVAQTLDLSAVEFLAVPNFLCTCSLVLQLLNPETIDLVEVALDGKTIETEVTHNTVRMTRFAKLVKKVGENGEPKEIGRAKLSVISQLQSDGTITTVQQWLPVRTI